MRYCLIGEAVNNSLSKVIHEKLSPIQYDLISLSSVDEAKAFISSFEGGMNITIPYKQLAYSLCNELSKEARETKVVNTIIKNKNIIKGYNTDVFGFEYLLSKNNIDITNKDCLILGTGASSRSIAYVLKNKNAKSIRYLSRNPNNINEYSYDCLEVSNSQVIINTTPKNVSLKLDVNVFKNVECFIDINYSPFRTSLMVEFYKRGVKVFNGLDMLFYQAVKANELFINRTINLENSEELLLNLRKNQIKYIFVGAPLSGKSTISLEFSKKHNLKFFDIDQLIEQKENMSINDIFKKHGEQYFRKVEKDILFQVLSLSGPIVISTGGGTLLDEDNYNEILKQGIVVKVSRDINLVKAKDIKNRPLIKTKKELENLLLERAAIYNKIFDVECFNNSIIGKVINELEKKL